MTTLGEPIGAAAVSRYRFVRHLATGGMAEIYAAEATGVAGTSRHVAVKRVLREHIDDEVILTMFGREARLAVRLQHPNIVQTYDVLDANGELYITMELLDGLSLLDLLRLQDPDEPGLTIAQATYVVDRVLAGLHYAHELLGPEGEPLGIVHRDVSPHNVFLTLDGNVKLLDFGVAKVATAGESNTETGVVKGKVLYMAPEHCQGAEVDRRADVFSAGLLLYTLLTNVHPFKGRNPYDTMRAVIHDPLPHPHQHRPDLPQGLADILVRSLEKDPDERYPTAREMRNALAEQVREHGLYITDSEFSHFIANEVPTQDHSSVPDNLPPDLVIGAVPEIHTGRHPSADASLAETQHAIVERVFGVTLLQLRGKLDEAFDPTPLVPHLRGTLLVDTANVTVITSYGIRGLLQLYEGHTTDAIYHLRCSVAFLQQVAMVRQLLGGGRILSFHAPYIDPVNGNPFTVLLEGRMAARVLESRTPLPWSCPGFPDRDAHFDEDPQGYFSFGDSFYETPDADLRAVIEGLAAEHRRREVEKGVDAEGTHVWIRRPLQSSFRWRNLLGGVEGRVHLDFEDTPSWTDDGIRALVKALGKEAEGIVSLKVTHAPRPLVERLMEAGWEDRIVDSTGRVHARCAECEVPRRVAVGFDLLPSIRENTELSERCPACDGALLSTDDFHDLGPLPTQRPLVERESTPVVEPSPASGPPAIVWVTLALGVAAAVFAGLWIATL